MSWLSVPQALSAHPPEWRDRLAIAGADGSLTFAELKDGMLRFAAWLRSQAGITPGDRVAFCLPKDLAAVQVIYGILAAGAAYVPLQFEGPPSRLRAILASVAPKLLLTTPDMAARLAAADKDAAMPPVQIIEAGSATNAFGPLCASVTPAPCAPARPEDLAAIYFTSGSTGLPKGVMQSHGNLMATIAWVRQVRQQKETDRLINNSGLHYIASFELFFPVFSGCRILLLGEREAMFPDRLAELLDAEGITHVTLTATGLRLLFEGGDLKRRRFDHLRLVEFFGEPLPAATLGRIMAALPKSDFINIYGATEAYEMASFLVPRPIPADLTTLPVGKPSAQYDVSLRDERGAVVPPGEIGEVWVAGPQVTVGYWNDPQLTRSKRFEGRSDSFRTGDFAMMGEDGLLRLVGRRDQFVKLRGHRFDLGEIEAVLKTHPDVGDAVAFAIPLSAEDTEIRAAVLVNGAGDPMAGLRRLCINRLPSFARPGRIAVLHQFPTLSTGKTDRQALRTLVEQA